MAELLWGQVYLHDVYAGVLRQEPGDRCSFAYDPSYIAGKHPPVGWTLPVQEKPHISDHGLHAFFDNLVAEGWLEEAQTRLLGKHYASRFELLLAFGQDCAGAVAVRDSTPARLDAAGIDRADPKQMALLKGRASLSGIQPKFTLVKEKGKFRAARAGETSTHIAKFASARHDDLVMNEYLTMQAYQALVPGDVVAELAIGEVADSAEPALIIRRFDRAADGGRVHFEEFNQLLGRPSHAKYEGAYKEMGDFIRNAPGCLPAEIYQLYLRVLAGLLLGNTDMHFKNFAMFHTPGGFRLTPTYDQVAAVLYDFKTIALAIGGHELYWTDLKARSLVRLGDEFGLSRDAMMMAYENLTTRRELMVDVLNEDRQGSAEMKSKIIKMVNRRWNATFSLIGRALSMKR